MLDPIDQINDIMEGIKIWKRVEKAAPPAQEANDDADQGAM